MQEIDTRKRALLLAGGWTLLIAAAIASFKSSAFEPIYLWPLGVMALAWVLLWLRVLERERRASMVALAAAGDETRAAIDALAQAVGAEMHKAGSELLRVDELLADAIGQLLAVFSSVSARAGCQRQDLALAAAAAQGTPAAERLRQAAERVAQDVDGAVTALQFRDVVGQKLGHVRRELEALERVLQRIRALSAAPSEPGQAQFAEGVRALLRELDAAKAASPAQQELMHAGEVELF